MKSITTLIELKEEIALLETKQEGNARDLKEQFKIGFESLRPVNLIKSTVKELVSAPDLKGNILNATIGIGAGYLTRKVVIGSTLNPLKQLLGTLLQVGITNVVSRKGDGIKAGTLKLIGNLFAKKKQDE